MPSSIPHPPLPRLIIYVNKMTSLVMVCGISIKHILRFTTKFNRLKKTSFKIVSTSRVFITRKIPSFWSDLTQLEKLSRLQLCNLERLFHLF